MPQVRPLRKQLTGLRAWITGQRKDQSPGTRMAVPVVQVRLRGWLGVQLNCACRLRSAGRSGRTLVCLVPMLQCLCIANNLPQLHSDRMMLALWGAESRPVSNCSQVDPVFEGLDGGAGSLIKYNPLSNLSSAETWNFLRVMVSRLALLLLCLLWPACCGSSFSGQGCRKHQLAVT